MKGLKINYDKTFATKYSRDYYRGTSFHYSGKWAAGVHYVADSYNTDFCASHQVLLACKLSHTSDEYNDPAKHFIYDEDQNIIGIKSKYWDIVIAGINIIGETKEWVDERIDGVIEAYKADIEFSARGLRTEFTHDIDDAVNGVTRNYRSEISQTAEEIRSTVEAVETSLDGKMEENYSELKQRADSISATVAQNKSDIEGNLEQKYSELKMTADEIATTVSDVKTDLEGNINNKFSEISQRADQISARVEEVNSNLNGDLEEKYSELKMTADEITSTVAANKTELDNTIQENYSQLSQRADSITATVAQNRSDLEGNIEQKYSEMVMTADEISTTVAKNKADLEGNIESKFSEVSQKADEIAARVEEVSQQSTGELEKKYSELIMTTDAISATVAANKTATDGSISDLSSNITQTATEIRSEVNQKITDVDGKVEEAKSSISQTADQIMATVEANKTELDGTISANYSELKQTAEEISARVTANKTATDGRIEENYSKLKQTAEEISSTVTSNKKAAEDALDAVNEELSSRITQTSEAITSEVEARTTREGEIVSDYTSKIQQTAEAITSEVSAREAAIEGVQTDYNSKISQTATNITSSVKATTDALGERITTAETSITQNTQGISLTAEKLNTLETSVGERFATDAELLQSLQKQVDGAIETYYYDYEPTLQNFPASEWTTDEIKENHVGDLFYNKSTGYSYRFFNDNGTYKWSRILDSDITTALAKAAEAKTTADGKMTIFYDQPSTYRKGDLWIMEVAGAGDTGDKKDCIIKKSTEDRNNNYVSSDWVLVSDIANASKVKAAFNIMADMIDSQVAEYTSDNELVPSSLYSHIVQSRNQISLKIGQAKSEAIDDATGQVSGVKQNLLDTGIDITNKKIEMTADNIILKNNSGTRSLSIADGSDGKPIIAASNLQLDGVLSIGDWNNGKMDLEAYARNKADDAKNSAISTAADDATTKANNAQSNAEAAAKADLATKLGYDSYEAMVIAAQNGNTIINGGYLRTNLIDTDALYVKHLNGADGTFTGALNAATGSFSGEVTASKFTISNDATVSGLKVSQVNGAASSSDLATTNNNVTAAKNRADSAYELAQQAGTAAGDAETNAKNDLAKRLGYTSYDDMVEKAQAGKTIIDGAYIRTGLINADALQVKAANVTGTLAIGNIPDLSSKYLTEHQSLAGYMNESTYIQGGFIKTSLIKVSELQITNTQVSGLGDLATKNNIGTSDLDSTIISGGYIKTGLIKASELEVSAANITGTLTASQIDATDLHVSAANIDGTITATNLEAATGTFTGTLSAATGSFSGSITAENGNIGGWAIQPNYLDLYDPDNDWHRLRMGYWEDDRSGRYYVFAAGEDWENSDDFNFAIDDKGYMYAQGGKIGGFDIGTSKLCNGLATLSGTTDGVYLGTDGIALGGGKFKVTKAGYLTTTYGQIAQFKVDSEKLSYGFQHDNHTTSYFYLTPKGMTVGLNNDDSDYPIYDFSINTEDSTNSAVCTITRHTSAGTALSIDVGQTRSTGIEIYDASLNSTCIRPDEIYMYNTQSRTMPINISATSASIITCNVGMFAGLRPKTRYITSSTSSSDRYLDSLDYNIIVNNSNSIVLYLPKSGKDGQTYYIMHVTSSSLEISGTNSSGNANIYSMYANNTLSSVTLSSRGTLLIVWNASQSKWICDILSSY